jgi:hypothetical protein
LAEFFLGIAQCLEMSDKDECIDDQERFFIPCSSVRELIVEAPDAVLPIIKQHGNSVLF